MRYREPAHDPEPAVTQVLVVDNLIENAIRHAPSGSTVQLVARVPAGATELQVSDAGPGIHHAA